MAPPKVIGITMSDGGDFAPDASSDFDSKKADNLESKGVGNVSFDWSALADSVTNSNNIFFVDTKPRNRSMMGSLFMASSMMVVTDKSVFLHPEDRTDLKDGFMVNKSGFSKYLGAAFAVAQLKNIAQGGSVRIKLQDQFDDEKYTELSAKFEVIPYGSVLKVEKRRTGKIFGYLTVDLTYETGSNRKTISFYSCGKHEPNPTETERLFKILREKSEEARSGAKSEQVKGETKS